MGGRRYRDAGLPVVLVAGERYGTGSSRDWAAKGQRLLGIRAVALSFERIHRSNLIGMGILPLRLPPQWGPTRLKLAPGDRIEINAPANALRATVPVRVLRADGEQLAFDAIAAVETQLETELLAAGGVMPRILRQALDRQASGRRMKPGYSGAHEIAELHRRADRGPDPGRGHAARLAPARADAGRQAARVALAGQQALRQLADKGLVTRMPNRGYFVAQDLPDALLLSLDNAPDPTREAYFRIADDLLGGARCRKAVTESLLRQRYGLTASQLNAVLDRIGAEGWIERRPATAGNSRP